MEINCAKCKAVQLGTNNEYFWHEQGAHHLELLRDRHLAVQTDASKYPEALTEHRITANHQEAEMKEKILEHARSISIGMRSINSIAQEMVRPPPQKKADDYSV